MKTIIDAVNELQGDLSNVSHIKDDDTYHCNVNYNADSGWWCSRGVYGDFVCTIGDFQARVKGMSFYYARWDIGSIEEYLAADKTPLQAELIDGKAYQFDYGKYTSLGFYDESDSCFYDTACFDEEIIHKSRATNIRPLTLE
jgi:hypothetical protein